jgi:hypothetical protein
MSLFSFQVFYVDNLDVGDRNIDHRELPRIKAYDNASINYVISQDMLSKKGDTPAFYGRLLVSKIKHDTVKNVMFMFFFMCLTNSQQYVFWEKKLHSQGLLQRFATSVTLTRG